MLTLQGTQTLRGVAESADVVTISVFGDESNGETENDFTTLYQGQLTASVDILYTTPSLHSALVKSIHIRNTHPTLSKWVELFVGGLDNENSIARFVIPANAMAVYDGQWNVYDAGGVISVFGTPGTNGVDGSIWHEGSGAPDSGLGIDGDLYLDDSTGDVYQKDTGAWGVIANILGPQGDTGPSGSSGSPITATALKTANYTAAAGDFVPVDTTSGAITITLPTAPANNTAIGVKMVVQGGTNAVTVARGGSDVFNKASGSTSLTISRVNQSVYLLYRTTGAIWYVVATDPSLTIGTDVQAYDAELAALAGLTSAANKLPYFTGSGTAALADLTAAGRALIDDADATAQRATLTVEPYGRTTFSNADYTVLATDIYVAQIGTMSAARTVTLPAASSVPAGWQIIVADASGTVSVSNTLTIQRTGSDTINGANTVVMSAGYTGRRLISDGTSKWFFEGAVMRTTQNLADLASAVSARINLGVEIGVNVQAYDAELAALAGVTSAADKVPYFTGSGTASVTDFTSFARTLLDDPDASTMRTTLGVTSSTDKLGLTPTAVKTTAYTAAVGDFVPVDTTSGNVTVTLPTAPADGSVIGVKHVIRGSTNTVTIARGGSDVFNKASGSTSLTLTQVLQGVILQYKSSSSIWYVVAADQAYVIGTDVQAYDAELAALAGVTSAADKVPYFTGSGTAAVADFTTAGRALVDDADAAAQRTTLGLATVASSGSASDLGSGTLPAGRMPALTGDVTTSAGAVATTIAARAVSYAKMQAVSATARLLGRNTAGAGDVEELSAATVKTMLAIAQADVSGLTTASNPQFATVELGNASDTTLSRSAAGVLAVEGHPVQPWDAVITKAANESVTSSTVLQNDDELFIALTSGKVYHIELFIVYDSPAGGGTGDLKVAFGEDGTARGAFTVNRLNATDSAANTAIEANQTTTTIAGTATGPRGALVTGVYTSAGGTFRFLWAQNTSDANAVRVLAGSNLRYRLVA